MNSIHVMLLFELCGTSIFLPVHSREVTYDSGFVLRLVWYSIQHCFLEGMGSTESLVFCRTLVVRVFLVSQDSPEAV